jgi:hypothetical protein
MPLFVYESRDVGLTDLTDHPIRESQPKSNPSSSQIIRSPSPIAIAPPHVSPALSAGTQPLSPVPSPRVCRSQRHTPSSSLPRRSLPFSESSCPVCLEDFVPSQSTIRGLPCGHDFHAECVDAFLQERSSLCPFCKKSVLPRGYCPDKLTNAVVRRERLMRRMRERVVVEIVNGPEADRAEPQRRSILEGQREEQREEQGEEQRRRFLGPHFDRPASSPRREVSIPLALETVVASHDQISSAPET